MNLFGKLMAKLNFTNLINNNTGVSSKNFFLVAVTLIGAILLLMLIISIIIDLIHNGTVTMSWADMGMFVGSVSTMFCAVGITKAWSEKYERTPGPDGILGTEDDFYIKKSSGYEYTLEEKNEEVSNSQIESSN